MNHFVFCKANKYTESLVADITLIRSFTRMYSQMFFKRGLFQKARWAEFTNKWFLSCMPSLMINPGPLIEETLFTVGTFEWLIACMFSYVLFEDCFKVETFLTYFALEAFLLVFLV